MIWEQKIATIVMLTRLKENEVVMQYDLIGNLALVDLFINLLYTCFNVLY